MIFKSLEIVSYTESLQLLLFFDKYKINKKDTGGKNYTIFFSNYDPII